MRTIQIGSAEWAQVTVRRAGVRLDGAIVSLAAIRAERRKAAGYGALVGIGVSLCFGLCAHTALTARAISATQTALRAHYESAMHNEAIHASRECESQVDSELAIAWEHMPRR